MPIFLNLNHKTHLLRTSVKNKSFKERISMLERVYRAELGIYSFFNLSITLTISQGKRGTVSSDLLCYDINKNMIHALIFALMVKENSKNSKKEDLVCYVSFSSQVNSLPRSPTTAWLGQAVDKGRKIFSFQTKLLLEERRQDQPFGNCKTRIQKQLFKRTSIFP